MHVCARVVHQPPETFQLHCVEGVFVYLLRAMPSKDDDDTAQAKGLAAGAAAGALGSAAYAGIAKGVSDAAKHSPEVVGAVAAVGMGVAVVAVTAGHAVGNAVMAPFRRFMPRKQPVDHRYWYD